MRQVSIIVLVSLMLLQPFSKISIVFSFKINQKEIAEKLCSQKEEKHNTCQGKCLLKKEIKKADEQEKKQAPNQQKDKYETLFCQHLPLIEPLYMVKITQQKSMRPDHIDFVYTSYLQDIFHPPEFILV
ncbi:MAG: hypothetical protein LC107_11465 [Chitinophagales bacterium]|nr:hypothetical protein [Chitinophagales bacterium]